MPKLPVWTIWRGKVYDVVGDGPVVVLVACDGERIGAIWDDADGLMLDPFTVPEHRNDDFGRPVPTVIAPWNCHPASPARGQRLWAAAQRLDRRALPA